MLRTSLRWLIVPFFLKHAVFRDLLQHQLKVKDQKNIFWGKKSLIHYQQVEEEDTERWRSPCGTMLHSQLAQRTWKIKWKPFLYLLAPLIIVFRRQAVLQPAWLRNRVSQT